MRTIAHDDIYNHIYTETRLHQFWYGTAQIFNPLKYSKDVNSHSGRKTAFTQALGLQRRKLKSNPYNASAEARTTSLTFMREWLWPLGLSPSGCLNFLCWLFKRNLLAGLGKSHVFFTGGDGEFGEVSDINLECRFQTHFCTLGNCLGNTLMSHYAISLTLFLFSFFSFKPVENSIASKELFSIKFTTIY